jgi:hypothetical protein
MLSAVASSGEPLRRYGGLFLCKTNAYLIVGAGGRVFAGDDRKETHNKAKVGCLHIVGQVHQSRLQLTLIAYYGNSSAFYGLIVPPTIQVERVWNTSIGNETIRPIYGENIDLRRGCRM